MNMFDAALAVLALVETVTDVIAWQGDGAGARDESRTNMSLLKVVRLCRVARVVRLLRFPIFQDLVRMMEGIVGSGRTFFWVILLVLVPVYTCALFLRETLGAYKDRETKYFTSIPKAMFTVFRCLMGDCSSDTNAHIFDAVAAKHGWVYGVLYCVLC